MAKYFSLLSLLFGALLMPGSPLISARDIPVNEISLVKEPEEHYYLAKRSPAVITCQAKNAAEIIYTCMGTQIPETSVEAEDVSDIDPGLIQAKIEVTRADVQYYEGGEPFWCTCSAVDEDGQVAVTSRRGYVSIAYLRNTFPVHPTSVTATVNEDVEFFCTPPEGRPKPEMRWRKDKKRLDVENNPRLIITDLGSLVIQSVGVGDEGLYQCVATNLAARRETKNAVLKVIALEESSEPQVAISEGDHVSKNETELSKPRATRQTYKTYFTEEPQEKYYITEDKSLLIDCGVVAADILTFRCNGKRMDRIRQVINQGLDTSGNRNIQSHLNITYADVQKFQAESADNQPYQCICVAWFQDSGSPNGWGRLDSKSELGFVYLAYLDDAFENEPSDVAAAPNTDVMMVCEPPQGEPHPWVYWYKDDSRLDPRSSNKYIVNAKGHLRIDKVQPEDAGAYHCVAENVVKSLQSRVGRLTVTAAAAETTTAGHPAEDDFPEFPEVIPSTPVFLRDFQTEYTVDIAGTRPMVCAAISAEQLTMDCGGKRLAAEEYQLQTKVHRESNKRLLFAKTDISAENVALNPDGYFCQCIAWFLTEQNTWEKVISAKGYIKLGAAQTTYIGNVFAMAPVDTNAYFESDAELLCKPPEGNPPPRVYWLKDGARIDPHADPNFVMTDEGALIIEYVHVTDEGQYTCVAENMAGRRSSKPVQFTVLGKPEATAGRPDPALTSPKPETTQAQKLEAPVFTLALDPEYYIIREQPVNLSCSVVAATALVFVCNGEVLQGTIDTDVQTWHPDFQESIVNSLTVTKAKVDLHTGSVPYTCVCRAHYIQDGAEDEQTSHVDSSPAVIQVAFLRNHFLQEPSDTKVTLFGRAELVCTPPNGIPEPEVHWVKNGYRISQTERVQVKDSGNLVINNFTEEDEGTYTCVVENLIRSKTSRTAMVTLSDADIDSVTNPDAGHTSTAPPESSTHGEVKRPYFGVPYISKDLHSTYYLIMDKPITITCEAYDVESITFTCGQQSVEDLNVFARVEQQVLSNGQSEPVEVFEASVNVSKEKVESYEAGVDYLCQCFAHYRNSTGEYQALNSTKAVVKIAYLNEEFEKEPESHTVTEGGFLTVFCKPPIGSPEPQVSWIKDGERFNALSIVQNNLLVFTETELEHTGEYICVAENEAGKRQSSPVLIEIKAKNDSSLVKGDTDEGDSEFDVDKESDKEPATNVEAETRLVMNPSVDREMDKHVGETKQEEAEKNINVLKNGQQEENINEGWSAKNFSSQNEEEDENYLEKNPIIVLEAEADNDHTEEDDTEGVLEGGSVNIGGRQKIDAIKCEQILSYCEDIFPHSAHSLDMCIALPQHISCIESYISKCRGVVDEDSLTSAKMNYADAQVACSLQPKCPQLERCRRVSSTMLNNHQTVDRFCQDDRTLLQCVDHAITTCNGTLSPDEQEVKLNLYKVVDWLSDFCHRMILGSKPLASCDEMMACDLHMEPMATDNSTSWCKLMSSLVGCTNGAVSKCGLNELRNDLEELHSDARHIFCSVDGMEEKDSGPLPDIMPEPDRKTDQTSTPETKNDRITGNNDDDDDDDDDGNKVTGIEGGAAGKVNAEDVDHGHRNIHIIDDNENDSDDFEYEQEVKEKWVTSKRYDERYDAYEDNNENEFHENKEENSRSKESRHFMAEKHKHYVIDKEDEDNYGDVYKNLAEDGEESNNQRNDGYQRENKDSVVAASKEGSDNGSAILCTPVLLATILQLLTMTLYLR